MKKTAMQGYGSLKRFENLIRALSRRTVCRNNSIIINDNNTYLKWPRKSFTKIFMSNNSFAKSFQIFDSRYAKVLIPNLVLDEGIWR